MVIVKYFEDILPGLITLAMHKGNILISHILHHGIRKFNMRIPKEITNS